MVSRQARVLRGARVHAQGRMWLTVGVCAFHIPTCNGAKDDELLRGGSLMELFTLFKALLSHQAGLSFTPELYAEDGGGEEGVRR
jgi:hypothetical protein